MLGPYDVPNYRIDGYDVVVNKPKVAAYRAPGAPISAFAVETAVDEGVFTDAQTLAKASWTRSCAVSTS